MAKLGVSFEVAETLQTAGISQGPGTMFLTATSSYGPEEPTRVRSLSEVERLYAPSGRESENAKLYDACNAFFAIGGQAAYVNKVSGASAKAALLELEAGATAKTLVVTAKYKGTYGNSIKLQVTNASSKAQLKIIAPNGEILETSGEYAEAKELFEWGTTHTTYVVITEGSGYSTGKSGLLKTLASTPLASGVNPTTTEAEGIKAIEGFPKTLGPGTYVTTYEAFKEKIHEAMHLQAQKNNRFAACDIEGSETVGTTAATLITNKKAGVTSAVQLGYGAYFSSAITATGTTVGTTRTIPFSPVFAGLCAKVSALGTDNRAPAGPRWSLAPFVTGFTNTYSETAMTELNEAGINSVAERSGVLCLFGDVSACPITKDLIFWQYSAGRERMRLVWECEQVLEKYQFITLDGRHLKRAKMQGDLQAVCKRQWELESLYGETAAEASSVNVGEPVNTPTTEQEGQLNAEVAVRLSPVVQGLRGILVSVPITEAL
jgi:hypothetical protein